ncbi:MAG: tryptophan synthase subunit alpha [Candidatus Methanomethylophilaceae archaeon]
MSNTGKAFEHGKAFIGFITAGDPDEGSTLDFAREMIRAGVDLIELGIPFSDPIAEGPVIQRSSIRGLRSGMTLDKAFGIVAAIRKESQIPIAFMTYVNPIFRYGYDNFFRRCKDTGVDALILPDLPYEEKGEPSAPAEKYGIDLISFIAPTSNDRIRMIASEATGFIYAVSSMGVTGVRENFSSNIEDIVKTAKASSHVPVAVGFGISKPEQARYFAQFSDGVIVGSAIERLIEEHGRDAAPYVYDYVKSMKDAIRDL